MSQTYSASQNSPSYDDSDTEYHTPLRRFPFPAQNPDTASAGAPFTSQNPEIPSTTPVANPAEQRPSRPLDVSTILNPTPQRTQEYPRRGSFGYLGSPRSRARSTGQHGSARSLPPSPVEFSSSVATGHRDGITLRTSAPSLSAPGDLRLHRHSQGNLPDALAGDSMNSPLSFSTPRRPGPYPRDSFPSPRPLQNPAPQYSRPLALPHLPQPHARSSLFQLPPTSSSAQYSQGYAISTPIASAHPSPTSSYAAHTPPGQPPRPMPQSAFQPPPFQSGPSGQRSPGEPSYTLTGPAGNAARGTYPMMALSTAHGTMQIPVDTTAASKIADEKRKRNAGASARFRQRRKEREREMTSRISDLERRMKRTEDERDYYRNLVLRMRQQQGGQFPPLPPISPRLPDLSQTTQDYGSTEAGMDSSEGESGMSGMAEDTLGETSARGAQHHKDQRYR